MGSPRRSRSRSRSPYDYDRGSRSPERGEKRRRRERRGSSSERNESPSRCSNDAIRSAWRMIEKDPNDFEVWMNLLNLLDHFNEVPVTRTIYERFLVLYPFCYGFWKKYADFEKRNNNVSECIKVWERSVIAIPLSIDLWLGYLACMKELVAQLGEDSGLKDLYHRALSTAGLEFKSDRLWNDAIAYEESKNNWKDVGVIYEKLLKIPTAMFQSHYERYMSIVNAYEPDVYLSDEEYEEITTLVRKHIDLGIDQFYTDETIAEQVPDNADDTYKPIITTRRKHHAEVIAFFRAEIASRRKKVYEKTSAMVNCRLPFEELIKRPYFHVKPLEEAQLKNWREYLTFEINNGDSKRILVLFERCLIACALYDEFWLKYSRWYMQEKKSKDVRETITRGMVHCPKSVHLVLALSAYEETQGNSEEALDVLEKFERRQPGYAIINVRKLGILRRTEQNDPKPSYSDVINKWETLIHSPDSTRNLSSYYSLKLARFHLKIRDDRRLAAKILKTALERDRDNIQLHLQLIDMAYTDPEFSVTRVIEAFDAALESNISDAERIRMSQRKLDFLEDLCYDIKIVQKHYERHHELLKELEVSEGQTRKRKHVSSRYDGRRDHEDHRSSRNDHRRDDRGGGGANQQQYMYMQPQPTYYYPNNGGYVDPQFAAAGNSYQQYY